MSEETRAREAITALARSMFDRGLTHGTTGNISARLSDGRILMTPTGVSFGWLDPATLSLLDTDGRQLSGASPTKERPLHTAFYETRAGTGAVVHLHSTHSVAWSMMPEVDPDAVIPPLTSYAVMRAGRVKLLPFFVPGDPAMADAIRALSGTRSAVMLANHGPVVAGQDLISAAAAIEEIEETARLALLTRGVPRTGLSPEQIRAVAQAFNTEWS